MFGPRTEDPPVQSGARCAGVPLAVALLLVGGLCVSASRADDEHPQILFLNSYHWGYAWSDNIAAGVRDGFQPAERYDLYVEFMDTKRDNSTEHYDALARDYARKYGEADLDVVICSDDNAFDFVFERRAALFPGVPVVFCGVNDFSPARLRGQTNITGICEAVDVRGTLEVALALHPDRRTVAVISDSTTTGRINAQLFERIAPDFSDRVEFVRLTDALTTRELCDRLRALPPDALVLYLTLLRDADGATYSVEQGLRLIVDHARVPIYGMWRFLLGHGAVGGLMVSGEVQGRAAADLAQRILAGELAGEIPVVTDSPNVYVFDDALLRKFGADRRALPPESVLINRPSGFYARYWPWLWAGGAAFALQTLLIVGLLTNRAMRRRAERALRRSEERAELVLSSLELSAWDWDLQRDALTRDASWSRMLGYAPDEVAGTLEAWATLLHPDDSRRVRAALDAHLAGQTALYETEQRLRTKGGEYRWTLDRGRVVERDAAGRPLRMIGTQQDIHDRKLASEALAASERRYRAHFELAQVGLAITSHDKRWIEVNDRLCEILGYSREEMVRRTWADMTYPEDLAADEREFAKLASGEIDHYSMEKRFVRRDGEIVYALISAIAVRRADRSIDHFVGLVQDVTDRKRAELALRRSEDRLRKALDVANEALWEWDVITDEAYLSPAWFRMLEYEPDALPHRFESWSETLHPDDRERVVRRLRTAMQRGDGDFRVEMRVLTATGCERWMLCRGQVDLRDPKGQAVRTIGTQIDITDLKLAEQAARHSEERLQAILDSMPDVVLQLDRELNVRWANRAAEVLSGGAVGKPCYEVFHGGREPCVACPALRCVEDDAVAIGQISHEALGGAAKHWEDVCVPLRDGDGRPVGSLVIARDITARVEAEEQRRQLEQQVQQTQKLESLGVLAGGIAHDFNNLLVGILGNVDLALDELSGAAPARSRLLGIETAAKRAADLTRQMLAYSGKGKFVVEPVDLNALVEEMGHLLQVSISKRVVLRYNFADNLPTVEADATQMRQVVMNLIINASEAIGEKSGVISVTTGAADCDAEYLQTTRLHDDLQPGPYVYLEVADTGCGMDADTQSRIFDPFYTTKFTGRGLGLAAVLGIVRGHGGAIKVYSEPGRGTTFKALFPASEKTVRQREGEAADADGWRGGGIVLLADDEETVCTVGKLMLERVGFGVLTASDGRAAVEICRERGDDICCVILDLTMPHLDGEEAFRQLRQMGLAAPVILSSGYNEQEVSQRFVGKGLAGFVQKPYKQQTLLAAVRQALEARASAD